VGVTGAIVEPIAATRSFEAPTGGGRQKKTAPRGAASAEADAEAPTRRGGPRPITQTSIKAITGDYAKADDNESRHRPTARRITERLPTAEPSAAAPRVERRGPHETPRAAAVPRSADAVRPAILRQAWLQGALTGALVLTLAWLASLIARAG